MAEIAVLTNPTAGKGRGRQVADAVVPRLRAAGFDVRDLMAPDRDGVASLTRECVSDGIETVVAVGGDGMIHLVIQELVGTGSRLGVVPCGTGNDVARYFGISANDPAAATDILIGGKDRTIDVGRAGSHYFITVLAAGFDAIVNERANGMARPRGQMRYNLATLLELPRFKPLRYTVERDGVAETFEAMLVAIGNGSSFGGGLRITEGAVLDDGKLDVVVIEPISKPELIRTYPKLFRGTHTRHSAYRHHLAERITIAAPGIVAYADGERIGALPMTVAIVPASLRVVVP